MTGWQRFFLIFAICVGILICWPQYDAKGLSFMVLAFAFWTCMVMFFSFSIELFGIYKVEWLHRLLSLAFLALVTFSFLYYFPLPHQQTPLQRLQQGQWPTSEDMRAGIRRLTFNFDFVHRNVHREQNFINQKVNNTDADKTKKELKKAVKKPAEILEIIMEKNEEEK